LGRTNAVKIARAKGAQLASAATECFLRVFPKLSRCKNGPCGSEIPSFLMGLSAPFLFQQSLRYAEPQTCSFHWPVVHLFPRTGCLWHAVSCLKGRGCSDPSCGKSAREQAASAADEDT